MKINQKFWIVISLVNLMIVAVIGTLMRYKIGFSFPHFDQKNLQHAHSHFAFIGWITHTLYILMVAVLQRDYPDVRIRKYRNIVMTNLLLSYAMLISFSTSGYSPLSIALSTGSIFVSYIFATVFFSDLNKLGDKPYRNWFGAALWFNIISSLGTFTLGIMMATHNFDQKVHLASLYYYLHFQYNGFFMFACMGLLVAQLIHLVPGFKLNGRIFWILCISCVPAYVLSVLWIKLPLWAFAVVILAAIAQVIGWFWFLYQTRFAYHLKDGIFKTGRYILLVIAISLSVKFFLQLGSTVPAISKMAFGFRPIIIAYLHLILLAIISVFLVWYFFMFGALQHNKVSKIGLVMFVVAVYINQVLLGIQGIASLSYTMVPMINQLLFVAAVLILITVVVLIVSQKSRVAKT